MHDRARRVVTISPRTHAHAATFDLPNQAAEFSVSFPRCFAFARTRWGTRADARAAGIRFARPHDVLAELAVSGVECVEALCTAGFRVRRRGAGQTLLERGARTIVVPDRLVLSPELLAAILTAADLSEERFVWLLGEVTTDSEIVCAPGGTGDA